MVESLFPVEVSENEYFSDLARAKVIVDHGIRDYFILVDPYCFRNVKEIGNTTLKDVENFFGGGYIQFFRFAGHFPSGNTAQLESEEYQSFCIRRPSKSDKALLRGKGIRFFPPDAWVCDWRDGAGFGMLQPFVQNENTLGIKWLLYDRAYNPNYKGGASFDFAPCIYMKHFIERLPDYFNCQLALCRYKNVDIAIPIAPKTAKVTFKNRDKDELGVKRHIVHEVKSFKRVNSDNDVEKHLRGRSDIFIRGERITITAPLEWSEERKLKKALSKNKRDQRVKWH